MIKLFTTLALAAVATVPRVADDRADVMATINQFVDGFNKKDSAFTFALQKGPAGWKITGWSWAKN